MTTATIDLSTRDVDEYYNGYANSTLWPLFHYRLDLTEYERETGKGYERVNERFAESVTPLIEKDDLVWVQVDRGISVEYGSDASVLLCGLDLEQASDVEVMFF